MPRFRFTLASTCHLAILDGTKVGGGGGAVGVTLRFSKPNVVGPTEKAGAALAENSRFMVRFLLP